MDSGCGGIQAPLFSDDTFEFIPIPDDRTLDRRTYGNTIGRSGRRLADFFPVRQQKRMATQPMHVDPEFQTFTYGDPTSPKRGLRNLTKGDLLVFYAGLEGFDFVSAPALYMIGYFEVEAAGLATSFSASQLGTYFVRNFHVMHANLFRQQRKDLVLVKGSERSRLFRKAHLLSTTTQSAGKPPLKVLSHPMRKIFGNFGGRFSFQRSPTRWVESKFVDRAAAYVRSL